MLPVFSESKSSDNDSRHMLLFFLGLVVALFVYIISRAYLLSFVHDESVTFKILSGRSEWVFDANNHWLNTALSILSSQLFGFSEFALRLPNALSFLFYSYFCYRLVVKKATLLSSKIFPLLFLLFNPLLIDFFGLSRGYGLAIAFCSGSLFLFLDFIEKSNDKILAKALFCSVLTVYSNYSFVVPIIALHIAYLTYGCFVDWKQIFKKKYLMFYSLELASLFPALLNVLRLQSNKRLYFGGTKGFIEDTLFSIFDVTFSLAFFESQNWFIFLTALILVLSVFFIKRSRKLNFLIIVLLVLLLLPVALNLVLNIKYPMGRAALYWVIFLGVYFHVIIEDLFKSPKKVLSICLTTIIACLSLWVVFSFCSTMNFKNTLVWKYDADTRLMLEVLNEEIEIDKKYSIGINWIFEPSVNYYRETKYYDWLTPVTRDGVSSKEYDYYYIFKKDSVDIACKKEIASFETSKTKLVKNCGK